jgi:large subunit ribosomal protein L24
MSQTGTRIRKGDTVRVITGKDKGKEGKVLHAIAPTESTKKPRPSRLLVEGINVIVKHKKAQPKQNVSAAAARQQSGRIELEAPIYSSKVMLVCPACGNMTRVSVKKNEAGHPYRACKKCGKAVD